jgi:hypothetical protein
MDVGKALGANLPAGTYPIMLFVPSHDRKGDPIDRERWVHEALSVLGRLFRGATGLPGFGVWRDDQQAGQLIHEQPVIVFCLANPADVTKAAARELRQFLHRMGRETNQGEVGVVLEGNYWGITKFDRTGA